MKLKNLLEILLNRKKKILAVRKLFNIIFKSEMNFSSSQSEMKTSFWLSKSKNLSLSLTEKTPNANRNKKLCLRVTESNNSSLKLPFVAVENKQKDEILGEEKNYFGSLQ